MASCSQKANLLGKRKPEDGLGTEPVLKKHKEQSEEKEIQARVELLLSDEVDETTEEAAEIKKTLFVACLPPQTKISDIIRFFKDVGQVVRVLLQATDKGKCVGQGFVEFASANQAKKALEKKKNEYLHKRKIFMDVAHKEALRLPPKYQEDYLQQESLRIQENPKFAEAVATVRNKTICVTHFSGQTKISDIISFFKDVGQVVHVRLIVNPKIKHVRLGFVEFASANEAEKALEKNGEYLYDRDIFLDFIKEATYTILSRYEDYPQQESLLIEEHEAAETPDFVEDVNLMKTTVFFACLAMKKENCSMLNIIKIFKYVGEVVRVRLIVDNRGESLGCGFVEFASAEEAKKAVQEKSGSAIYVKVAEKAPYLFRPKCNLADLAEKLWYEDKLRREGFGLPSKSELRKEEAVFCGKKITFSDKD
ncbi:hypothetical protein N665_1195s0012 [Sinapis alba]|nr:hypothetical protein N665_1195s0012 [Sinapis alba]